MRTCHMCGQQTYPDCRELARKIVDYMKGNTLCDCERCEEEVDTVRLILEANLLPDEYVEFTGDNG